MAELTDFSKLSEGTRFVEAREYANTQDELPLGLDWQAAYEKLAAHHLDSRWSKNNPWIGTVSFSEMVKFQNAGLLLNGLGTSSVEPTDKVITGPPLKDLPQFGGLLRAEDSLVLHQLFEKGCFRIPKTALHAKQNVGILMGLAAARVLGQSLFRLDKVKLLYVYDDAVSLTNLGILRVFQDNQE